MRSKLMEQLNALCRPPPSVVYMRRVLSVSLRQYQLRMASSHTAPSSTRLHAHGNDIFCKIIRGEIPSKKRFENDAVLAFDDLNPVAPVHILIVPKLHTKGISSVFGSGAEEADESQLPLRELAAGSASDAEIVGQLFAAAAKVAEAVGIAESGYRLVINNGKDAGQTVPHLHLHLIGGRPLSWPPG